MNQLAALLVAVLLSGCGDKTKSKTETPEPSGGNGGGHAHSAEELHGPNGGPMFKLTAAGGENYHVEWFKFDEQVGEKTKKKVAVVILNEDSGEIAVAADKVQVEAEVGGKTSTHELLPIGDGDKHSRFEAAESLALLGALLPESGHSHIHVTIDGKEYEAHVFKHSHSH